VAVSVGEAQQVHRPPMACQVCQSVSKLHSARGQRPHMLQGLASTRVCVPPGNRIGSKLGCTCTVAHKACNQAQEKFSQVSVEMLVFH